MARFLAPAVAIYAAWKALATILAEQLQMARLRRLSGHVVICGLGRKALQLARAFREHGDSVVVIERDGGKGEVRSARELGAIVLVGSATDPMLLRRARVHHAGQVIAFCGDDGTNVEIAVRAFGLVEQAGAPLSAPVQCFVHIVDLELIRLFKQHRIFAGAGARFEARLFNFYESSARLALREHPLDGDGIRADDPRRVHLVVVGFGQMGEAMVLQAAKTGHFANRRRLQITVVDRAAEAKWRRFARRYPQFGQVCDARPLQGDADDPGVLDRVLAAARDAGEHTAVAVCFDDDARCLSCALTLLAALGDDDIEVHVRTSEDAGLARLSQAATSRSQWAERVHPFGMIDLVCTRAMLVDEPLDRLAKAIHEHYRRRRRDEKKPETDPSTLPWERLDEDLKDSNRQQADHIPVKLRAVGCYSSAHDSEDPVVEAFTPEEAEVLAPMEHARWNAERFLAGWTKGPKDIESKQSPYLVDWDELPPEIQDYDRQAVEQIPRLLASLTRERVYRKAEPDAAADGGAHG